MKKTLLIALLASFISNAQEKKTNRIEISPFIGVSSSNYYGNINLENNKNLIAPIFGVDGDFFINDRWSIKAGFEYQTLGSKVYVEEFVEYPAGNYYYEYYYAKEKLKFISIPLHANLHFGRLKNWNFNFGPTIGFILSGSFNGEKFDNDILRKEQFGLGIGIGYRFEIDEEYSLGIDYQEYVGLTSNLNSTFMYPKPFIGNISGNFNLRLIYKLQ